MIVLFTDFGLEGPYLGQVQAVLHREVPNVPVINLFSDLTPYDIQSAAYLLPAYCSGFAAGCVFLCVVDPGVGGDRPAVVVRADDRWFVGPNEGLFALLARRAAAIECWQVPVPPGASASFHGRDVFAPLAAGLAQDGRHTGMPLAAQQLEQPDWPDDLLQVVYTDRFGNLLTGLRAFGIDERAIIEINGQCLRHAHTFSGVGEGEAFWYGNSNGLVELAVNRGSAARVLGVNHGHRFIVQCD